ncbi:Tetratricopeptide-like helical [Corchorus olitorius]|uniref:Tetratricopeptide-like helical n=1 Tax=Corchorus olitorius TaxID=93759 RepID=A0A1R3GDP0_9ROSI|nr:Tetratricopeptide-like helical [Corchorus olitorius]
MGACKAPIFHLLSSPNPSTTKTLKNPLLLNPEKTTSRRFLLFSIPLSSLFILPSSSSNYALSSTGPAGSFMAALAASFEPVSKAERDASAAITRRVAEAVELLEKGKELQAQGDFSKALQFFTLVVENYKDFALTEYARVGRALALYEVGDREEAIAEMEDVSISLKGYPEVHAALAAALYVDKHAPLLAENQFAIATLLDPKFTDLSYVRETKHWPPSLVSSLKHFITLS